jgi:hypothetical protein
MAPGKVIVCEVHDGSWSGIVAVPLVVGWVACEIQHGLQLVETAQRLYWYSNTISLAPTNTGSAKLDDPKLVELGLGSSSTSCGVAFWLAARTQISALKPLPLKPGGRGWGRF